MELMEVNNEKKILKNSMYLYIRMLLSLFIVLYSSRIVLLNLGVVDFGIYSVVAGVIYILGVFNNALTSSTHRFLSFSLVEENNFNPIVIFNASIRIHILFALFILIIGESAGLYFVKSYLNIPNDRLLSTIYLYHTVLFIFILNILSIPYQALINAKEDMKIIAVLGVMDSIGKLLAALSLGYYFFDKLKLYGILLLILNVVIFICYLLFCNKNYIESKLQSFKINKETYLDLFFFALWTTFGSISSLIKTQGSMVLLNIFFGPIVNAALAIGNQISSQLLRISQVILKAVNPQIVKSYGRGKFNEMVNYLNSSSKYSFYLFCFIAIPLFFEMDLILNIWLDEYPEYTVIFSKILILNVLVDILIGPLIIGIQASGKIKYYQLTSGLVFMLNLLIMYVLLLFNFTPSSVIFSNIFFTIVVGGIRLFFLNKQIKMPIHFWLKDVLFRCMLIIIIWSLVLYAIFSTFDFGYFNLLMTCIISSIFGVFIVYFLGLNSQEKIYTLNYIKRKISIET